MKLITDQEQCNVCSRIVVNENRWNWKKHYSSLCVGVPRHLLDLCKHWACKMSVHCPEFIGNNVYYFIQRKFGGLRKSDSLYFQNITASKKIWELIISSKKVPNDKVFFELGTGRVPEVPFYLWLMGADKTYTSDIQYLAKNNLISEFFKNVIKNEKIVRDELGEFLIEERISEFKSNFLTRKESELIEFTQKIDSLVSFFSKL